MAQTGTGQITVTFLASDFEINNDENVNPAEIGQQRFGNFEKRQLAQKSGRGSLQSLFIPKRRWDKAFRRYKDNKDGGSDCLGVTEDEQQRHEHEHNVREQRGQCESMSEKGSVIGDTTDVSSIARNKHDRLKSILNENSVVNNQLKKSGSCLIPKRMSKKAMSTATVIATATATATAETTAPGNSFSLNVQFSEKKERYLQRARTAAGKHMIGLMDRFRSNVKMIKNYDNNRKPGGKARARGALDVGSRFPPLQIFLLDTCIWRELIDVCATKQIIVMEFYISDQVRESSPVITVDP